MREGGDGGDAADRGNCRGDGYGTDSGIQHDATPTSTD